jgi:hypothetical protein
MSLLDPHSSHQLSGTSESSGTEASLSLQVKQANFAFLSSMERGSHPLSPSRLEETMHDDSEVRFNKAIGQKSHYF